MCKIFVGDSVHLRIESLRKKYVFGFEKNVKNTDNKKTPLAQKLFNACSRFFVNTW